MPQQIVCKLYLLQQVSPSITFKIEKKLVVYYVYGSYSQAYQNFKNTCIHNYQKLLSDTQKLHSEVAFQYSEVTFRSYIPMRFIW